MLDGLKKWLKSKERAIRTSFGDDISTPKARRQAKWHFNLFDHAWLRTFWTNFDKVAEGVYRSNHPSPERLKKYKAMGITTVLNLRGQESGFSPWLFEEEACRELGLNLVVAKIYARRPATKAEMLNLIHTLKTIEKPFVMHCKSGADRAGLASVLYKLIVEKSSVEEARKHLSPRYLHLKFTKTGICDHIIDMWEADHIATGIGAEEWFLTKYDPAEVNRSFAARNRREAA
ncbi:tyrosine-protein phosphatase [Vannielia litorea]|uniref:tyrosine-protein phosphatase n=1 Tax=Vannielia litorea TaxID=1217970 RepID=UPI001BCF00C3|nr:tyrosine-protein phosphatase [Vannielia litorea]MBS8224982.1 protein tyrosine phosphatase [Vannielia litorea]